MFWFEPLPQLSQLVELLTSSSLREGMQRTPQASELPEFCTLIYLSCGFSLAVIWWGNWTSALSFPTACGIGWSLSHSASCKCSRRGSLPLSVWSLLWFAMESHKGAICVCIYLYMHVYVYICTHTSDSVLSWHSGLPSKTSEEEVTRCTLSLSAKETKVISNCESV